MHEDETRTTECAFSIRQAARPRKRTFVTSSAKFQIARHAPGARAPGAHCPQMADVLLTATKRRTHRRETPARFPIYREFPRAFCFIKDILYISRFMEVVGFGVSNVFAIKQNSKRRTTRAVPHVFRRFSRRSGDLGRRPADRALRRSRSPSKIQNRALRAFSGALTPHFPQGYHGEHVR